MPQSRIRFPSALSIEVRGVILAATKEKGREDPTEIAPRLQQTADEVVTMYMENFW